MLQVIFIFISNIEVIKHKGYCLKKYCFGLILKLFFKDRNFSFFFLVVSLTCTDIPYKFLSIPKLVLTLFAVSVVVATPMIFTALMKELRQLKL